jgi:glycosyltransferase involved in cell wall biosynthesis
VARAEAVSATARRSPELVSVVMAVLNKERYIGEQLAALAAQTYQGAWELVVVDNGCRDASMDVVHRAAGSLPEVRIVTTRRRGVAVAKNAGVAEARGELIAFCDADDVVTPGWLAAMVEAARDTDLVTGPLDFMPLNDELRRGWRPDDPQTGLAVGEGFLPYAHGGNSAAWADVARAVGWDEAYRFGGGDWEFSWRAQLASYRLAYAPDAVVLRRYRETMPELVRQWYAYGHGAPLAYRNFRNAGMRRDLRQGLEVWRWLARNFGSLVESPARRGNWLRMAAFSAGRLAGSIRFRTLYL